MMKQPFAACMLVLSLAGGAAAQSAACPDADPALAKEAARVLTGATDPAIAGWAGYLNADFYRDLVCHMPDDTTIGDLRSFADDPAGLLRQVRQQQMNRNQSDALMLILSAMQSTEE